LYFRKSGSAKTANQSVGLQSFIQGTTIALLTCEACLMKAKRSFINYLVPATAGFLLLALSACSESQNENIQLAQVGSVPDAGAAQPVERVRLEGLRFKPDSASLRSGSKPILDAAVGVLKQEPDEQVYVDAYYSRAEHAKGDQQLAQHRAEKVKAYFAAQGIPPERMIARGFGGQDPAIDTAGAHRKDSSVELITFSNDSAISTKFAYLPSTSSKVN
jgi:outer membrane protein OmpA-like peptidoglycan-associated protein